jgi:hypothetical protein
MSDIDPNKKKRTVRAPAPTGRAPTGLQQPVAIPSQILSVDLAEDEDVEWNWTHFTDGRSAVTGYRIVKKPQ